MADDCAYFVFRVALITYRSTLSINMKHSFPPAGIGILIQGTKVEWCAIFQYVFFSQDLKLLDKTVHVCKCVNKK